MLSLSYLLIAFTLIIAYLLYILIILPLIRLHPYKKKGARVYFFPILGDFKENIQDFETKGDLLAKSREFSKEFPDKKYWFTNFSSQVMINLTSPEYVREFIQKQANYKKSSIVGLLSVLGTGLVFAEGDHWKRHRKIISNAFHYEFLKRNVYVIQNTTQEFLSKIGEKDYKDFPTIKKIQEITGEVVGRIFFKESLNTFTYRGKSLPLALAEVLCDLAECANGPLVMIFGPKVMNIPFVPQYKRLMDKVKGIRQMCLEIIQNRKAHPKECDDLLGLLLATQNSEDPEQRFSDEDIINEFVTFVSAGMDTTGHLVALALYNLTQHPELIPSIKKEIQETYSTEKNVSADTLQKMDVLHSVLKETLRFYTPFPGFVPREAVKDHNLLDIEVKKGALLRFDFFSIFFNEKYYDNPYAFDPSRWTRGEPKMDSYAFLPFSAGARNCLGQHLAIMEAKVIVSEFLKRFEFKLKEGYKLRMLFRFTYEPFEDVLLNLRPIS